MAKLCRPLILLIVLVLGQIACLAPASAAALAITRAEWSTSNGGRLTVAGTGTTSRTITIKNAASGATLASSRVRNSSWSTRINRPSPVPCRIRAEQSGGGGTVERDVANRPANCGPSTGLPSLSITGVTVTEGGSANFTVSLSTASSQSVSVIASTANNSAVAPGDYTARTGVTLTFPAGTTSQSFVVATVNDSVVEPTETFFVNLSGASNATIAVAQATGTILDNDTATTPPSLSINNVTVTEGGNANFAVSLSAASSQTVSVLASTANGSAVAPGDYTARTGVTLTFPAGTTSQTFTVKTIDDFSVEATETFTVNLSGATNATLADAQGVASITDNDQAATRPNVSINSTSQNSTSIPGTAVTQQPRSFTNNFQVLANNDLGMHCGDLDTRISSILPPFNVLHAQVVRKGSTGANRPTKLGEDQVIVRYSAAANPNDPILANPGSVLDSSFTAVYKTNFWEVARAAYDPFYPPNVLPMFYPAGSNILDLGLPMPDLERLYLGDGQLFADQQEMPGRLMPYDPASGNQTLSFSQFIGTQPFFTAFPFGYSAPVNWFEAAGIPITTFDDFGRENAYPLMRVQATAAPGNSLGLAAGTVLASLDTVLPVSGEANCAACHAATNDGGNGSAVARLVGKVTVSIDDPMFGSLPSLVSVEWAADKNILKLHDIKHATRLITGTTEDFPAAGADAFKPVVCQTCHYTPALDLAHVGPNDVNGRQQSNHKSMSAVMHAAHANATGTNGQRLFPDMPGPVGRDSIFAHQVLEQTCYQCHPGKRTQCLRGAMGQAGSVCQDCHGNLAQVGNDFSRNQPGGGFQLGSDFYSNANTPRVPWANQPGCGSCHTGDAVSNLTNTTGAVDAPDNIRLLQAWRAGDSQAKPIVPTNKRFAENVISSTENAAAAGNPKLFRVSTGHGGLSCEACHGSTHAEWSSSPANPNANDNLAANQLQGHPGAIMECSTCHTAATGTNLNGPHGMHPVADGNWINHHHEIAETTTEKNACRACHGVSGQGTPLSRTPIARTMSNRSFAKGEQVTCSKCHSNKL
ncbi:MAG: Calx-beta domain-containing protein [Gallionellaceae bacterium]|nr:Calx-beta domain-containing protein [Gallionellaceae bacterium]